MISSFEERLCNMDSLSDAEQELYDAADLEAMAEKIKYAAHRGCVLLMVCSQMDRGGNGNDGQLWSETAAARCFGYRCAAAAVCYCCWFPVIHLLAVPSL